MIKEPEDTVSVKAHFLIHRLAVYLCVLRQRKKEGSFQVSYIRALILLMSVSP